MLRTKKSVLVAVKLPVLDHALGGLDEAAKRLFTASRYGEWLNQVIPCGSIVGVVTSGTFGPTVEKNIALAYVPAELAKVGTEVAVRIREKDVPATVVKTPFYRRAQ